MDNQFQIFPNPSFPLFWSGLPLFLKPQYLRSASQLATFQDFYIKPRPLKYKKAAIFSLWTYYHSSTEKEVTYSISHILLFIIIPLATLARTTMLLYPSPLLIFIPVHVLWQIRRLPHFRFLPLPNPSLPLRVVLDRVLHPPPRPLARLQQCIAARVRQDPVVIVQPLPVSPHKNLL